MKSYLYLSLLPEALVASQLAPDDYGAYLAIGSQKRARGQAVFFKLSEPFAEDQLRASGAYELFEHNLTGKPRRSCYLSIYRVLEQIPISALESLHLVTDDGRVLTLRPGAYAPIPGPRFHLYQEFCPVNPRVVSTLDPLAFARHITDQSAPVNLPALVFAELQLGRLGDDPEAEDVSNLPYPNLEHLRDCLRELREKPAKHTKTAIRFLQQDVLFRTIVGGFHVAGPEGAHRYFPMPTRDQLEREFYPWWRSALSTFGA
jgi:hypothetical protein